MVERVNLAEGVLVCQGAVLDQKYSSLSFEAQYRTCMGMSMVLVPKRLIGRNQAKVKELPQSRVSAWGTPFG